MAERNKVILLAHQERSNLEIAPQLQTRPACVSKQRFSARRLDGLQDAQRQGGPAHDVAVFQQGPRSSPGHYSCSSHRPTRLGLVRRLSAPGDHCPRQVAKASAVVAHSQPICRAVTPAVSRREI
jgi:hypothetical protein